MRKYILELISQYNLDRNVNIADNLYYSFSLSNTLEIIVAELRVDG